MKLSSSKKERTSVSIPPSGKLKLILLVFAFILVAVTLWYTHGIVQQLTQREKVIADLYARSLEFIINSKNTEGEFNFVFNELIKTIDFPLILTTSDDEPIAPYHRNIRNIKLDTTLSDEQQRLYLKKLIRQYDQYNQPLNVTYQDTIILSRLHFGESELITILRWLPYIEMFAVGVFILIGYISFSYVRKSEQSNIWVGMARETAHQLGTPISGLLGWIEMLKEQALENSHISETIKEMENDLRRLQKIAGRFSKIGAKPDLQEENVCDVVQSVIAYFERRIPQLKRFQQSTDAIQFRIDAPSIVRAPINRELFEWVIENITKNALDAIETAPGVIEFSIREDSSYVIIDISDTGRGIDSRYRKYIFKPGFSTKRRGWGLGLSLAKRIVETYHHGKLMLSESKNGFSTTFRIKLLK